MISRALTWASRAVGLALLLPVWLAVAVAILVGCALALPVLVVRAIVRECAR